MRTKAISVLFFINVHHARVAKLDQNYKSIIKRLSKFSITVKSIRKRLKANALSNQNKRITFGAENVTITTIFSVQVNCDIK